MTHPLTTHLFLGYFNTTTVTYDSLITDPLIFTTMTLVIFYRTKNPFAEQTISFRLISPIVDGFRLEDFPTGSLQDLFWRCQSNRNLGKIGAFYFGVFPE